VGGGGGSQEKKKTGRRRKGSERGRGQGMQGTTKVTHKHNTIKGWETTNSREAPMRRGVTVKKRETILSVAISGGENVSLIKGEGKTTSWWGRGPQKKKSKSPNCLS